MPAWAPKLAWTLGCLLAALVSHRYQQRRAKRLLRTVGTVVDVETDSEGMRTPVISFTPLGGKPVTFTSGIGSNVTLLRRGHRVTVLYDPAKPQDALIAGWRQHFLTTIFCILAIAAWIGS